MVKPSTNNTPLRVMHSRPSLRSGRSLSIGTLCASRFALRASRLAPRASRFVLRASCLKTGRKRAIFAPERLYHAQKGSKTCNFPKPFKHIKIYLTCEPTTKYQVIPPINGRETKEKRKQKAENVQFWLSAPLLSAYTTRKKGRKRAMFQNPSNTSKYT